MNHQFESLIRGLKGLSLSDSAFAHIRSTLLSYADLHAVPDSVFASTFSGQFSAWLFDKRTASAFAVIALLFTGTGSVSYAAESAVPGDALYSLKVQVNEKVAATLATTGEERARHSARIAERRIDEAVALASEGKLDSETAAYIEQSVAAHLETSDNETDKLEAEGDIATALAVRTDLEAHMSEKAEVLHALAGNATDTATDVRAAKMAVASDIRATLADSLDEKALVLAESRRKTEMSILPGMAEIDEHIDLAALRPQGAATAATMVASVEVAPVDAKMGAAATTTADISSEEEEKDDSRWSPHFRDSSWNTDATQSLWYKTQR